MITATFPQLLFTWGLYSFWAILMLGNKADEFPRLIIWFALWLVLTPVSDSLACDWTCEVIGFFAVEFLYLQATAKLRWA